MATGHIPIFEIHIPKPITLFRQRMAAEREDDYSSDEFSSDEELQEEFARGELKPGLIARAAPPKTYTNNVAGLREKLAFLKKRDLEWLERMDVMAEPGPSTAASSAEIQSEGAASNEMEGEGEEEIDPEDDFKREMHFYQQACSSVKIGLRKLEELGVPIHRPEDYFAEMVKTDDHMRKVRESLLSRQKVLEHKEKSRKLRELKKYGKKVQQEILQKRREEKRAALDAVKKFRKGKGEKPSFLKRGDNEMEEEEFFPVGVAEGEREEEGSGGGGGKKKGGSREKSKKRQQKDAKFGYGGKKKWLKSNTAESSADMSQFRSSKHSKGPKRFGGQGAKGSGKRFGGLGSKSKPKVKRLGKSRRQKMKLKR